MLVLLQFNSQALFISIDVQNSLKYGTSIYYALIYVRSECLQCCNFSTLLPVKKRISTILLIFLFFLYVYFAQLKHNYYNSLSSRSGLMQPDLKVFITNPLWTFHAFVSKQRCSKKSFLFLLEDVLRADFCTGDPLNNLLHFQMK